MRLHLTKIGTPKTINTKYGPRQKSYVKATEYGENFLNYWLSPSNQNWHEGMEVEVDGVQEGTYNNKPTFDIHMPKVEKAQTTSPANDDTLRKVEFKIDKLTLLVEELVNNARVVDSDYPESSGQPEF